MVDPQTPPTTNPVVRPVMSKPPVTSTVVIGILLFVFILGSATGYMLAKLRPVSQKMSDVAGTVVVDSSGKKAGIIDKKTFSDTATGVLRDGGLEGEGSHHLERGAVDQTAYLTSSTVDLTPYVGKKVQVWGQTNTSQKTGWLMDVGYIEIVK